MRRSPLRSRLLLVSILVSALTVGGMALTSYVIVSDSMTSAAADRPRRMASTTQRVLAIQAAEVAGHLKNGEDATPEDVAFALEEFLHLVELTYGGRGPSDPQVAIFDSEVTLIWQGSEIAYVDGLDSARRAVLETATRTESVIERGTALPGLFAPAVLDVRVVHEPLLLPGGAAGVLDVAYYPLREEASIDAIRLPMLALALSAFAIMVIMMQTSMGWVLKLVNDLRQTADSLDADRLDVQLPESGEHEIGELARSVNRLIGRLRQRAEMQSRFVADASHELATPVAGIRGYINILRAWGGEDPEVRGEAIAAIDRESRRMARLCGNLLSLVRSDQVVHVKSVQFDANAVAREALAAAATHHHEKGLEIVGPEEGQLFMTSDPDRVEDILSVLLDNACKYTPEGGRVRLSTHRAQDEIVFEIADAGVGIPAEDLRNIFERFYRSDASRAELTGGFGLGLAIAKATVDVLHGSISVTSTVGEGSVFTVRLSRG
jgi:signal transduction histidine kinase